MANPFMRALALCALGLTLACGDDDGGTDGDDGNDEQDSGSRQDGGDDDGDQDAGDDDDRDAEPAEPVEVPDASTDELEEAKQIEGVNVSTRRAQLLFPLGCNHQAECDPTVVPQACVDDFLGDYMDGVSAGFDDACLDSSLDLFACFATADCADFMESCADLADKQAELCGQFIGDGGV